MFADGGLEGFEIHVTVVADGNLPCHVAAHHGARGVGAVCGVWDDDFATLRVASGIVVGADHGNAGELTLGAGHWRCGHRGHAGRRFQHLLQLVQAGEEALACGKFGERMTARESRL